MGEVAPNQLLLADGWADLGEPAGVCRAGSLASGSRRPDGQKRLRTRCLYQPPQGRGVKHGPLQVRGHDLKGAPPDCRYGASYCRTRLAEEEPIDEWLSAARGPQQGGEMAGIEPLPHEWAIDHHHARNEIRHHLVEQEGSDTAKAMTHDYDGSEAERID
jgi:hypothetical protein